MQAARITRSAIFRATEWYTVYVPTVWDGIARDALQ